MTKYEYMYLITCLVRIDVTYGVEITLSDLRNACDGINSMHLSAYTLYAR